MITSKNFENIARDCHAALESHEENAVDLFAQKYGLQSAGRSVLAELLFAAHSRTLPLSA